MLVTTADLVEVLEEQGLLVVVQEQQARVMPEELVVVPTMEVLQEAVAQVQ